MIIWEIGMENWNDNLGNWDDIWEIGMVICEFFMKFGKLGWDIGMIILEIGMMRNLAVISVEIIPENMFSSKVILKQIPEHIDSALKQNDWEINLKEPAQSNHHKPLGV